MSEPNLSDKNRHGCLTAYLVFLFVIGICPAYQAPSLDIPTWHKLYLVTITIIDVIWIVAIFKWKKWGFWGFCITRVGLMVISPFLFGFQLISILMLLLYAAMLYFVLQIGGENKGWEQMD